jgi:hypothetical protein
LQEHLFHVGKPELARMMLLKRVQLTDGNFVLLEGYLVRRKKARMSLTNAWATRGGNSIGLPGMAEI